MIYGIRFKSLGLDRSPSIMHGMNESSNAIRESSAMILAMASSVLQLSLESLEKRGSSPQA